MKRSNHSPLLKDLLADDSLETVRRQSLQRGMTLARRRRQRAGWTKGALFSALLLVALWLSLPAKRSPSARNQVPHGPVATDAASVAITTPSAKDPVAVRFISDDELLALFPGRSLALIGPPGRNTLIFLESSLMSDY